MRKKIYIGLLFTMLVAIFVLLAATSAVADSDPCPSPYPCGPISDFHSFVEDGCGNCINPIPCEPIESMDFQGTALIAAFARESGHRNQILWDNIVIFDTNSCLNWRALTLIDFDKPLVFRNESEYEDIVLDPYCPGGSDGNCDEFRLCRVTENNNFFLVGDIIVGSDDKHNSPPDYDDIIALVRPLSLACSPTLQLDCNQIRYCLVNTDCIGCPDEVYGLEISGMSDPPSCDSIVNPANKINPQSAEILQKEETGDDKTFEYIASSELVCPLQCWQFEEDGDNATCIGPFGGEMYCF